MAQWASARYVHHQSSFPGQQVEFDRVEVYRSIGAMFLCCDRYLAIFFRGHGRRFKRYLKIKGIRSPAWPAHGGPGIRTFLERLVAPVRWFRRGG